MPSRKKRPRKFTPRTLGKSLQRKTIKRFRKRKKGKRKFRLTKREATKRLQLKKSDFQIEWEIRRTRLQRIPGKRKRKRVFFFQRISINKFVPGRTYRIFVRHKPTGFRREMAFGKFDSPLAFKRERKSELDFFLGGRTFKPLPRATKAIGRWVPTWKILPAFKEEIEKMSKKRGVDVRGAIIPMKRFYHSAWKIFSDKPLVGTTRIKKAIVNVVVQFSYPQQQWVGKQNILWIAGTAEKDSPGIMLKNLIKRKEKIQDFLTGSLIGKHGEDIPEVLDINGFIPLFEGI